MNETQQERLLFIKKLLDSMHGHEIKARICALLFRDQHRTAYRFRFNRKSCKPYISNNEIVAGVRWIERKLPAELERAEVAYAWDILQGKDTFDYPF